MHEDWWALAGIKKPCSHDEKAKEEDQRLICKTLEGILSRSFSSFKM
jgi:hypothetical protein